jgi:hypothetical protein
MKKVVLFFFLLIISSTFGQVSYDFAEPLPPSALIAKTTLANHFGTYQLDSSDRLIIICEAGIFAQNNIVTSISRSTIRESTKYQIKDGMIYGVHPTEAYPCFLEGEDYYFGVPNSDLIIGEGCENKLVKISNNAYVLNFFENGTYTPCLIKIINDELRIQYFDYDSDTEAFKNLPVARATTNMGMKNITLKPDVDQFIEVNFSQMFGKENIYIRQVRPL